MGYGVIGSPAVSGTASLGSSPGTPARQQHRLSTMQDSTTSTAPSSSGPGRRPLTAVARVRIPSGLRTESPRPSRPGALVVSRDPSGGTPPTRLVRARNAGIASWGPDPAARALLREGGQG